ncbi:MAG: hypothetical protein BHW56_01825 [Acetobacter sp. 46_36]|nr:MAG: hypothetical protein BHW56_01825 [Acetobacter sp. 46_36]
MTTTFRFNRDILSDCGILSDCNLIAAGGLFSGLAWAGRRTGQVRNKAYFSGGIGRCRFFMCVER